MRRNMSLEENCMISLITPVLGQRGGGRGSNMAHLWGYIVPASLRVRRQRNGDDLPAGHNNCSFNFRITAPPERLTYYQKFVVLKDNWNVYANTSDEQVSVLGKRFVKFREIVPFGISLVQVGG